MTEYRVWRNALKWMIFVSAVLLGAWSVLVLTWNPARLFLRNHYLLLLWIGLVPGAIFAGAFLLLHRPSRWFRRESLNAVGWVWVIFLFYIRSMISIALLHQAIIWRGPGNALNGLGFLFAIDFLVIYRVISFLQYRLTYRKRQAELEAEYARLQEPPEI